MISALTANQLRVLAITALALGAMSNRPLLAGTSIAIGLGLYALGAARSRTREDQSTRWAGACLLVLVLAEMTIQTLGPSSEGEQRVQFLRLVLLTTAGALAFAAGGRRWIRLVAVLTVAVAFVVTTASVAVHEWQSEFGVDVYLMHLAAGDALVGGENPYTDAVKVPNGSPFAPEDAVIEGYPYPPVVLATYGGASAIIDPRVVSLIAMVVVLAWFGVHALKRVPESDVASAMFLLVAGSAVWPVVFFVSWTEPLSLALLVLAFATWRRPFLSGAILGLALASKQYFVFLGPFVLFLPGRSRPIRTAATVLATTCTVVIGLIPDSGAFVAATFGNLADIGFRPDSQSLSGVLAEFDLRFLLPSPAWIGIGLVGAYLIARRTSHLADMVARFALVLGCVFFVGQAFPNYWFLVLSLAGAATVVSSRQDQVERESAMAIA